jgi:hypothetical protein
MVPTLERLHGKCDAPHKKSDPIMLSWDRNGDGKPDVIFFDFKPYSSG